MRLPETYRAFVLDQQDQLAKIVKANGLAPIRKLYEDMLEEVSGRIADTAAGTFGQVQLRGMLAQIRLGLAQVQRDVVGALGDAAFQAALASARAALEGVARLEQHFTGALVRLPLLETARLNGLVQGETSSLLAAHERSVARYGVNLVRSMERQLGASLAAGESSSDAIDRITEVGDLEWWQGERIVRTELAYSASRSARTAYEAQAVELDGDLWMRWTEHVSDSGNPLDDRVAADSLAMHGQVAPPGGMFTQPPTAPGSAEDVPEGMVGREWPCPPNRPNDRAVLAPWRAHWGVPGWIWRDGRRVPATERLVAQINGR